MGHHFAFFIFQDCTDRGRFGARGKQRSTHLREKRKSRIQGSGLFISVYSLKFPLLYNLAGPDLGLGKTVRAFLRRVGLCRGIIVEWC